MIHEVALPFYSQLPCHEFLPIPDRPLHSRLARKRHDRMQMIRHQQTEAAMPDALFMVM